MKLLDFLLSFFRAPGAAVLVEPPSPEEPVKGDPKWLKIARGEIGIKEGPGAANNPVVLKYYADAGHPEVNSDEIAWCAAFAGAMLERAGVPSSKQLNARSYLTWGKPVTKPYPGCIAVFSRGDPRGWEGHVGFFLKEDGANIQILGGNMGDAVTIGNEPKSRLLGYREPVTAMNSRTLKAQTLGLVLGDGMTATGVTGAAVSAPGILDSLPDALAIGSSLQGLAAYWPWFTVIGITISILARMITIYARVSDLKVKGA